MDAITLQSLSALLQIVFIDLVLAGDNAIVIGLAAAGLPKQLRSKAIVAGIGAAAVLRIFFSAGTQLLLGFGGSLLIAGALLLLYVCWKMGKELRQSATGAEEATPLGSTAPDASQKTLAQAVWQIVIADISMSLDNVLAVAGAAGDRLWVLIFGLCLSVALMGLAASFVARLMQRFRWIAYVGLAIVFYVAVQMLLKGILQLM